MSSNNPAALAVHESHLLWPHETIQCVISLGTGRYEPTSELDSSRQISLKDKVNRVLDSATDTEGEGGGGGRECVCVCVGVCVWGVIAADRSPSKTRSTECWTAPRTQKVRGGGGGGAGSGWGCSRQISLKDKVNRVLDSATDTEGEGGGGGQGVCVCVCGCVCVGGDSSRQISLKDKVNRVLDSATDTEGEGGGGGGTQVVEGVGGGEPTSNPTWAGIAQ